MRLVKRTAFNLGFTTWPILLALAGATTTFSAFTARRFGTAQLLRGWDAQFYYAAARSLLVDGDLDVTNDLAESPAVEDFDVDGDGRLERPLRDERNRIVNKYPIGLSLIEVPWLAAGAILRDLHERATGTVSAAPAGFSVIEMQTVATGLVFITLVGLVLLYRLARKYGSVLSSGAAVAVTFAATPLLYYTTLTPFMSHCIGLTIVAFFLLRLKEMDAAEATRLRDFTGLAAAAGLLFLVRPQQAVVLAVSAPLVIRPLYRQPRPVRAALLSLLVLAGFLTVMLLVNKAQTGHLTLNAYATHGEGFDFAHPDFPTVLTRADRGLLWMSPIVLLACLGFLIGARRMDAIAWVVVISGIAQIYVVASWSSPEQGDSFGARMWIESLGFVVIGLLFLFESRARALRNSVLFLSALCVCWNIGLVLAKRQLTEDHLAVLHAVTHSLHDLLF